MIQELFGGGASLVGGERKFSFNGAVLEGSPLSTSSISTTSTTSTTATPIITTTTPPTDQQNLRCPRCDSSNTKFCYYNNYNLTQPRHFCKTCRRYWTKGGALRNVPIGGGCRKNKSSSTSSATTVKSSAAKIKTPEFGKSNFGFELEPPTNQVLWASPQNSQLMALLRAAQNQNPNPNPSSVAIKEEGAMVGSYMSSDSALGTSALNARPNGVDHVSQVPVGLYNSFWRNNQDQPQTQQHHHNQSQQHQQHSLLMGDVQNSGIQELFNRLRSSGNYYSNHSHPQFSNEASSTSSPSLTVMEPSPITGGEVGYWNPTLSWANLPTANGAFP